MSPIIISSYSSRPLQILYVISSLIITTSVSFTTHYPLLPFLFHLLKSCN